MAKCSGRMTQPYNGPQSAPSLLAACFSISSLPGAILTISSMYSNCVPSVWVSYSIFIIGTVPAPFCQCIHGRYETGQLPECCPEQLVHAGLITRRRYSHYLAQRKSVRTSNISLPPVSSIGAFRHVHVFRGKV